jgi:hypothetical protein
VLLLAGELELATTPRLAVAVGRTPPPSPPIFTPPVRNGSNGTTPEI